MVVERQAARFGSQYESSSGMVNSDLLHDGAELDPADEEHIVVVSCRSEVGRTSSVVYAKLMKSIEFTLLSMSDSHDDDECGLSRCAAR